MARYFSIQIFFIILRETLETAIIISVLLSFIKKRDPEGDSEDAGRIRTVNKGLKLQVWLGAILGLLICFAIGLVFVLCFYFIDTDLWSYTERLWEGVFCLLSSVIITVMGVGLLRINKVMKIKWWVKLGDAYQNDQPQINDLSPAESDSESTTALLGTPKKNAPKEKFSKKYFLAILPFITTLREGLEAVVFMGGIGMSQPLSSLPLAVLAGVLLGSGIGVSLYKGGNKLSLQYFLICSTCFLYVVSAGLLSRGVWFLELEKYVRLCGGLDVSETGSGPGSYDVANTVWHVNCCNGLTDGWWMVANAIVGWTNTATYGSVFSYIGYWLFVSVWLRVRMSEERNGHLPFVPIKWQLARIRKKVRLYEMRKQNCSQN
ncbi:iron permease FTR1 [Metschnikowia bicuspidata var. bicuspidata NRRL YB-4993]|uniref:Iron permease FTR1 n=1 Tax=Metschnikowia bicuspidata var. bicuspidata NRRL YB-4993 TaxID=869754 RepID=A0A1A0HKR0_9ASCO|nr:iron permease FTR1 [Metschnikowia bicuspidata var. bicuspidata NRRL YB-4993]OBA24393.1 iron permease FTR1 [Metschnikowia bicuspidata var. bicuspidata NRRL YB-4993]